MYRIDNKTAVKFMPVPEDAGEEGFFSEGSPSTGAPATAVRASWLNMVQEELRNIVLAGGITPSKESNTQVLEALLARFARRLTTAKGTPNEIVGIFNPIVSQLTDGMSVLVRAAYANASEIPTFQADQTDRKPIIKGHNLPLLAGDISGEGHWLELHFDARLDKWVLQNPAKGIQQQGVLVGSIEYFAMQTPPPGYLKADGASVSRTTYAELFATIGTVYGAGDGSGTFNLPDLRGEFVRGWDAGRNVDAGRAFGSAQGDAIRNIEGGFSHTNTGFNALTVTGPFTFSESRSNYYTGVPGLSNTLEFDASRVVPTATENRPRNIALLACIKAFDVAVNPGLIDITELANEMAGKVAFSDYTQNFLGNGWTRLPNKLILQWGYTTVGPHANVPVIFPITFSNAVFGVQATTHLATSATGSFNYQLHVVAPTLAGFSIDHPDTGSVGASWYAIGY